MQYVLKCGMPTGLNDCTVLKNDDEDISMCTDLMDDVGSSLSQTYPCITCWIYIFPGD